MKVLKLKQPGATRIKRKRHLGLKPGLPSRALKLIAKEPRPGTVMSLVRRVVIGPPARLHVVRVESETAPPPSILRKV